jgi:hypothetical protein
MYKVVTEMGESVDRRRWHQPHRLQKCKDMWYTRVTLFALSCDVCPPSGGEDSCQGDSAKTLTIEKARDRKDWINTTICELSATIHATVDVSDALIMPSNGVPTMSPTKRMSSVSRIVHRASYPE